MLKQSPEKRSLTPNLIKKFKNDRPLTSNKFLRRYQNLFTPMFYPNPGLVHSEIKAHSSQNINATK